MINIKKNAIIQDKTVDWGLKDTVKHKVRHLFYILIGLSVKNLLSPLVRTHALCLVYIHLFSDLHYTLVHISIKHIKMLLKVRTDATSPLILQLA